MVNRFVRNGTIALTGTALAGVALNWIAPTAQAATFTYDVEVTLTDTSSSNAEFRSLLGQTGRTSFTFDDSQARRTRTRRDATIGSYNFAAPISTTLLFDNIEQKAIGAPYFLSIATFYSNVGYVDETGQPYPSDPSLWVIERPGVRPIDPQLSSIMLSLGTGTVTYENIINFSPTTSIGASVNYERNRPIPSSIVGFFGYSRRYSDTEFSYGTGYSVFTLRSEAVPEPISTLGLVGAIGLGYWLKRRTA